MFLLLFSLTVIGQGASDAVPGNPSAEGPPLPTQSFEGTEPLSPQQQAAMQAYRSIETENLINQMFKLEGRLNALEQGQRTDRQSIARVGSLDSIQQVRELVALRMNYRRSLTDITQLMAGIDGIRKLHDWELFLGEAATLADPNSYEGFSAGLAALRQEQKNSLSLPTIEGLNNPYFSSFYTLSAALGSKDEPEDRKKIQRLLTILAYAMRAEKQLDYIAAELAFAGQTGDALHQRTETLRDKLYGLVNLEAGRLDEAREKFFNYQFSTDFAAKNNEEISDYLNEMDALRVEYSNFHSLLTNALRKAQFSLDRITPLAGESDTDLIDGLNERKAGIATKIQETARAVAGHHFTNGLVATDR